jgi:predicted PurR-regulated permease PerM
LLPPYRNADQDVRYGVRVAAGYAWRLIAITIAVYGIFIFLGRIQLVGVAVFVGLVISALLRPVADWLELVLPRALAVAVAVLAGVVFVAGVFAFIATSVAGQSATLSAQLSNGVNEIDQWLRRGPLHLSSSQLSGAVDQARLWISGHQAALIGQALGQASFALEVLTGFALAVFCSIFFIHSGDRMWAWFLRETPPTMRAKVDIAGRAAWETFAGYTRGIVIVAATNALLVCLALLGLRVPLALPLALLVFFATFIPIIGAPIALAVATVVALAGRGPLVALLVLVLIAVIGQIEGHVLQPLVMSRAVAIHPIVVALAVGCGTVLAGLVGAIIAVPLVSVAWAVNRKLRPIED